MHFDGRDLKPYEEPVAASTLEEGAVYFSVNFIDDDMMIPTMEPLVFVGRNLDAGDVDRVYFQDVDSFRNGVRYPATNEEDHATFYSGREAEIGHIFEFDRALDVLLRCSLRRSSP